MKKIIKVPRNAKCPCGSGKKYKYCCLDKDITWQIDESGNITKHIDIDDNIIKALRIQNERFKKIFGREMGGDDLVFFDQYSIPIEDSIDQIACAMDEVGIEPSIIYAFKKTGMVFIEQNLNKYTDQEIKEWNDAIEEYYNLDESKYSDELGNLVNEYEGLLIVYGMAVDMNGIIYNIDENKSNYTMEEFIMYCVTKTQKTIKSIFTQVDNGLIEDGYNLVRSIYENYLHIVFLLNCPEKLGDLVAAKIGLENGTHEYAKNKNGSINRRIIVEKYTGKEYEGSISSQRMAQSSSYKEDLIIHGMLYEKLSRYTHPNILSINSYINNNRFDAKKRNVPLDIYILTFFISVIILEQVIKMNKINRQVTFDIKSFLNIITPKLIYTIEYYNKTNKENLLQRIDDRLNRLLNNINRS